MKKKAQAWLRTLFGWGQRRQSRNAEKLYSDAIRLARRPEFFQKYGVADDVDGRFDALSLIVILVMRRLKSLDEGGKSLSQNLFDSMFADMDLSLREMGAGTLVSQSVLGPWLRPLWGVWIPTLVPLIIMIKSLFQLHWSAICSAVMKLLTLCQMGLSII